MAFFATLSAAASAQFDPSVISSLKTLRDNNGLPAQLPRGALQPTGFPGPDAKRPDEIVDQQAFRLINANEQTQHGRTYVFEGDVEFLARGYHVRCDKAEGDPVSQLFTLTGHVLITGNDTNVYGQKVTVDMVSGTYIAERAETQLTPQQTGIQGLSQKVYVSGKLSAGTQLLSHTEDADFTTCDLDDPHYHILSRDMEVRTGKRIILRDAKLIVLHKTILQVPFLVIPLDQDQDRYTPEVGYTDDEGYFIRNVYAFPVNRNGVLTTHEDYFTKLGLGLGGDYAYAYPTYTGVARLYHIFGSADDLDFSNSHRQAFRWGSVQLDNDYKHDDHLTAPGQTLLNTRAAVTYNDFLAARAIDRFTLNRSSSDSSTYSSISETLGVDDTRTVGKAKIDTQFSYLDTKNTTDGGTTSEAERGQVKFLGSQDLGPTTGSLTYQRSIPIGQTKQYIGSSDLTPVFALTTDSRRLFGQDFGRDVPLRIEASWGEYADPRRESQVDRTAFSLAYNKSSSQQERLTFDTGASFRQGIYSDDTAQYVLGFNENVRYKLGSDTGINLRYSSLEPYGYTPLSLDSTGKTDLVTTDINDRPIRSLLMGIQTGYDIQREKHGSDTVDGGRIAWQQVGIRSEWTPRSGILFRGLYTYDTYQQAFSQLRFDFSSIGRQARLNLNAQYDGIRHTWSTFNGTVDGFQVGRTRIAALFQYNGYLQKFESKQYAFIYDLHDAEAVLSVQENDTGFRPGRQIYLLLRLKAFPFSLPFGTGTRGQGVGVGNGVSF